MSLLGFNINNPLLNEPRTTDKEIKLNNGRVLKLKRKRKIESGRNLMMGTFDGGINMGLLWEKVRVNEKIETEINKLDQEIVEFGKEFTENGNVNVNEKLWTEKYRPKNFIDLIGNEKVNSNILKWLNDWNHCINNGKLMLEEKDEEGDVLLRPQNKILLIHGPPGVGKTSISHCIAKQLNYEIQEINASDERVGDNVKEKIKNSINSNCLNGKKICLILDEVDGTVDNDSGIIKFLIDILRKDRAAVEDIRSGKGKKKELRNKLIRRPIIAICNNIFSKSIENFKKYCEIIKFEKLNNKMIERRILKICECEKINYANNKLIKKIIEFSNGDIRNCINYIQFNKQNLGLKSTNDIDGTKFKFFKNSWIDICNRVFTRNSTKLIKKEQFRLLFNDLLNNNSVYEMEKITAECFNLMFKANNCDLAKTSKVYDWLFYQDSTNRNKNLMNSEDLVFYNTVVPLKFFSIFNELNNLSKRTDFPRGSSSSSSGNGNGNNSVMRTIDLKNEIHDVFTRLSLLNLNTDLGKLVLYEVDLLAKIILPIKLDFKGYEQAAAKVGRSIALIRRNKLFIDTHYFDNTQACVLKPDILLVLIHTHTQYNHDAMVFLNYLKLEIVRKSRQDKASTNSNSNGNKRSAEQRGEVSNNGYDNYNNNNKNKRLQVRSSVEFFKKRYSDFSNKVGETTSAEGIGGSTSTHAHTHSHTHDGMSVDVRGVMGHNNNRVWVKFHEGYSNAVRKDITWQTLFG